MGWPNIPNSPKPDGVVNPVLDYDYGREFRYNDESGVITNVPPAIKRVIPTLVPKVDAFMAFSVGIVPVPGEMAAG